MKRLYLVIAITAILIFPSNALAFMIYDTFDADADGWIPDQILAKYDGVNWEGWIADGDGYYKNAAHEYFWKKSYVSGVNPNAGQWQVDVRKESLAAGNGMGLIFGGDLNNSMFTAGITTDDAITFNLIIQEWASPDGGTTWAPTTGWNLAAIPALSTATNHLLILDLSPSLASISLGGDSASMAISGIPSGKVGLYNSVGWTSFDNFQASVTAIPEPSSFLLLGFSLLGAGLFKRRLSI